MKKEKKQHKQKLEEKMQWKNFGNENGKYGSDCCSQFVQKELQIWTVKGATEERISNRADESGFAACGEDI